MNYLPFKQRSSRLRIIREPSQARVPRWQWLLLVSLTVLTILLGLVSSEAEAIRSDKPFWQNLPPERSPLIVSLPLELPAPATHLGKVNFQKATFSEEDWDTIIVKRGDNLSSLFLRLGLGAQQVQDILDLGAPTTALTHLLPGQQIKLRINDKRELQELVYEVEEKSLHVRRDQDKLQAITANYTFETRIGYATGVITNSLLEAAQQAGLSVTVTLQMAAVFGWDIDFAQDLREGDSFTLLYEEYYLEGEKVRDGPLIAAEFTNRGKTYRTLRFSDGNGQASYYTPEGLSMHKAFLRTPVEFTRVSSGFSLGRYHPILHHLRAHKGVDYAAPLGTPIKAASDGKITFRGKKGGYGNTIVLQHVGKYSTLYGHMSRFAPGLRQGASVRQGQIIGYVGQSGLATGPHLHYEFRINGVHHDPLTVELPKAEPIPAEYRGTFSEQAGRLLAQMALFKSSMLSLKPPSL